MIRELTTTVIDCDGCDTVYAAVVPVSEASIRSFARVDGWTELNNDGEATHYCPKCVAAQQNIPVSDEPVEAVF